MYRRETRTTCSVEAYNGVLGRKIKNHANFFVFAEALQKEEFAKSIALAQEIPLVNMGNGRRNRLVNDQNLYLAQSIHISYQFIHRFD